MKLLRLISFIIFAALFLLLILFFLNNDQPVDIALPGNDYSATIPFYVIISATFLLGLFFGNLLFLFKSLKQKREIRRGEKRQKMLEEEIAQLKAKNLTPLD